MSETTRTVLWIDDAAEHRQFGKAALSELPEVEVLLARDSDEAFRCFDQHDGRIDVVVSDILRRNASGGVAADDGAEFFQSFIRPNWPELPVVFHTKNYPGSVPSDGHTELLCKWDKEAVKAITLRNIVEERVRCYRNRIDLDIWTQIEPRLIEINSLLLGRMRTMEDIWRLTPEQFEQMVAELLDKIGYTVLWIPGGKDQGIDIVASSSERDYLIDVKRYRSDRPVGVELVRGVYGASVAAGENRSRITRGGIVTSSYFTSDARCFEKSMRRRPLLRDWAWLAKELPKYAPHVPTVGGAHDS